jgi:hypothetical protein
MAVKISKIEVWAAELQDRPGGLARILEALADANSSVECLIARRQPDRPGSGVAFVTPVKSKKAQAAATSAGMHTSAISTLKVEGNDKPGLGAALCRAIADAGVNMRGLSAAVVGNKFVAYFGFDNADDANKAAKAMKAAKVNAKKP